jgi:hypothetical protein
LISFQSASRAATFGRRSADSKYCQVLEWLLTEFWIGWLDLLTSYTHDSELQAVTAPPLISTINKSPQLPLSLFQPASLPW